MRNFFGARPSTLDPRPSERGIALVITLILLSVTLVMALAFMAVSQRERSSVTTTTDATTARLAAETALAHAEAQILSTMLATTNPYNYGLVVSTNYIKPDGYDPTLGADPKNVNYDGLVAGGGPLSAAQLQQNIANLFYLPRAPVYIVTNQSSGATDFRFYLDLNRNGQFDTNGVVTNVDNASPPNGLGNTLQVGDPEWIGVLERPDTEHGPNNKFISRYAFVAVPIGNTLDVNYVHNQNPVHNRNLLPGQDAFFRNEGVGSWEINLAAFLTDLNTNQWDPPTTWNPTVDPYTYQEPSFNNTGRSFEDALSILNYRYNGSYNTLAIPSIAARVALINAGIDTYTIGNLMTNTQLPAATALPTPANWVGSDNTNHFFTLGDLFDPTKITATNFIYDLQQAGKNSSTYDRYTFYRMLAQLGTDSTPESGLMNLNYDNVDVTNGTASATNFVPWTPVGFFTNAADRMLRLYTTNWFYASLTTNLNAITTNSYLATYYGIIYTNPIYSDQYGNVYGLTNAPFFGNTNQVPAFGLTSIPVLINGQFVYPSAVNRILQLAANMYDATTNRYYDASFTPLPTVFKPVFDVLNSSNVYITNFVEVTDTTFFNTDKILNINNGPQTVALLQPNDLVFGVPLIIGAKKGFPNFNQFYMENTFQLTRKLLVTRKSTNSTVTANPNDFGYYEQFSVGLTNQFGVEMWNSYRSNYTRPTDIYVTNYITMMLTNDEGSFSFYNGTTASGYLHFDSTTPWSGYNNYFPTNSFKIPLTTNFAAIPGDIYLFNNFAPPQLTTNQTVVFQTNYPSTYGLFPQPHWGLTITNNLQVIMIDSTTHRLIDYVQLGGPNTVRDLTAEIQQNYEAVYGVKDTGYNNLWNTNLSNGGVPIGITEQLNVSEGKGNPPYSSTLWGESLQSAYDQMNALLVFLNGNNATLLRPSGYVLNPAQLGINSSSNSIQVAYTPTATVVQDITWQANDPLVHYLASDLNNPALGLGLGTKAKWPGNLGISVNQRYMPWASGNAADQNQYNPALKDPLVHSSDDWDFPTNKFPTVGWLGRVHRGTPWQTVYLKASNILKTGGIGTWTNWTGNLNPFDATNTAPLQDRLLFDLFTTSPNDNATRGQLSVNQTNLAAWSAVFSGMVVPSTSPTNNYSVISPAGLNTTNSALWQLVNGTNGINGSRMNFPGQAFAHKGDILSTLQLTEQSPFLDLTKTNFNTDEMYEWLPQQAMSLLRAPSAPRYVIYGYGQALKPAPNGIVTSGPFFQMITNYSVVTESAVRAVIRVEGANTPSPHIVVESINPLPPD